VPGHDAQQRRGTGTLGWKYRCLFSGSVLLIAAASHPNPGRPYLGNSDRNQPFIGGTIEYNLIRDPVGYCMQIKHQNPRPAIEALPREPTTTIIRYNVFIKGDRPSPDGNRPDLLVDGFPDDGPGSQDRYQVYGNVFFHNSRESLFQANGRVSIH